MQSTCKYRVFHCFYHSLRWRQSRQFRGSLMRLRCIAYDGESCIHGFPFLHSQSSTPHVRWPILTILSQNSAHLLLTQRRSPPRTQGITEVTTHLVCDWHPDRAGSLGIIISDIKPSRQISNHLRSSASPAVIFLPTRHG